MVESRSQPVPIELRHRTYFAYLDVPIDVRKRMGRRVFRQTLQTDSRSVAERRAAPLIAQWKAEIERAREEPNHNDARFWRDAPARGLLLGPVLPLRHQKDLGLGHVLGPHQQTLAVLDLDTEGLGGRTDASFVRLV